jgi:hypothetical protein
LPKFQFLRLPEEARKRIYEALFVIEGPFCWSVSERRKKGGTVDQEDVIFFKRPHYQRPQGFIARPALELLGTCTKVYNEAAAVLYSRHEISYWLGRANVSHVPKVSNFPFDHIVHMQIFLAPDESIDKDNIDDLVRRLPKMKALTNLRIMVAYPYNTYYTLEDPKARKIIKENLTPLLQAVDSKVNVCFEGAPSLGLGLQWHVSSRDLRTLADEIRSSNGVVELEVTKE